VRRSQEHVEQGLDAFEARIRPGLDQRWLVVMAQDPSIEGRDRDIDARRAQVRDEDMSGVSPERELSRRPPPGAWTRVAFADQSPIHQLGNAAGNDRPAKAGSLDELRTRSRSSKANLIEDHDE